MKYKFFVLILSIMIGHETLSQTQSTDIAPNLIYLEVLGVGGFGSVNYERVIYNKKYLMIAMRLGIGSYNIKDFTNKINPDILIPISINGYFGNNHKIEWGVGVTFSNIVHADLTEFKPKRITNFHTNSSIGYRYQKNTGGIIFRCAYTPIIEFNKHFRHWVGISFGYSF